MEAGLNSDPGNDSFSDKIRDAKHVDRSTHYTFIVHKLASPALPGHSRSALNF